MLGNLFAPIASVLVADYVFVKRMRIDMVACLNATDPTGTWRGFNPIAAASTVPGFLIYMFVIPPAHVQIVCTVVITDAGYWATARLVALRSEVMERASRPGEQRKSVDELAWDLAVR